MKRVGTMGNVYNAVKAYLHANTFDATDRQPIGKSAGNQESKFTRWYNNPRNRQHVSICNRLIAAGVMSVQGKLL